MNIKTSPLHNLLPIHKTILSGTHLAMSEQKVLEQRSGEILSELAESQRDSDDEPMVYETRKDYATSARQSHDQLIAEGVDPNSIIFQSNLRNHVPRLEGESSADFAKRYAETINAMIRRGVTILNDQCTSEVVASQFRTGDGRFFDLGPRSGATRGEFRDFCQWFSEASKASKARQMYEVPGKWLKFEKQR